MQLVLGRALMEQEQLDEADEVFALAETSFEQLSSDSHRASPGWRRATSPPDVEATVPPPGFTGGPPRRSKTYVSSSKREKHRGGRR